MNLNRLEGIILNKKPLKGRNLCSELLLRNGTKVTVIFYGGIGGGKKSKSGIIELGQMIEVVIKDRKKKNLKMLEAKEWNLTWYSKEIRTNHRAFYLMCFILEIISFVATNYTSNYEEEVANDFEHIGLFNLLSNNLYYIDLALQNNLFRKDFFLIIFFSRLLQELGILPDIDGCIFCKKGEIHKYSRLNFEAGGFICEDCSSDFNQNLNDSLLVEIIKFTKNNFKTLFCELKDEKFPFQNLQESIRKFNNFFLYQFQLEQDKIKSASFIL